MNESVLTVSDQYVFFVVNNWTILELGPTFLEFNQIYEIIFSEEIYDFK